MGHINKFLLLAHIMLALNIIAHIIENEKVYSHMYLGKCIRTNTLYIKVHSPLHSAHPSAAICSWCQKLLINFSSFYLPKL